MPRRTTCRSIRDLLPLHAGGDLLPDEATRVDEHLHACLACFREFREHATMRGRLGVLAEEPLPPGVLDGFTEEVMARIAVDAGGPAAELPAARRWRLELPPVRLAAAAAVLLAVSAWMAWQADWLGAPGSRPSTPRSLPVPHAGVLAGAPAAGDPPVAQPHAADPQLPRLVARDPLGILVDSGNWRALEMPSIDLRLLPDGGVLQLIASPSDAGGLVPVANGLVPEPGRELRPR
jgi:anti-sigma factor RsiW